MKPLPLKSMASEDTVYSPRSLAQVFSNFFITPEEKRSLRIKGVFCDKKGPDYNGHYYDRLRDEASGDYLTVKIPALLKTRLKDGRPYIFEGFIDRRTSNSVNKELNIYLIFVVTQVISEEAPLLDATEYARAEVFRGKSERGFRNVDTIIKNLLSQGKKPSIAIIYGRTAITNDDVTSAGGAELDYYDISSHRIGMSNKEGLIEALEDLGNLGEYDIIALVRGGGSGLEIFDDVDVARTVAGMSTPVVTAIGHANDHPFVQVVSDRAFNTPTAFGEYLRQTASSTFQEIAQASAFAEREKLYQQQLEALTKANETLERERQRPAQVNRLVWVAWLIAGLLLGLILAYIFRFGLVW